MTVAHETTTEAQAAAHRRAMPLARLIANGMEWADAHELHAMSEQLVPWHIAARRIGDGVLARAETALGAGHRRTARECFQFASAAYRFGQNPLPDGDGKRELYRRMIEAYGRCCDLLGGVEHVTIPTAAGALHGWLHVPRDTPDTSSVVLLLGGFDGWREEYHGGARRIVDAGSAVLMLDGPGQGESRVFGGVYMPADAGGWDTAMAQVVTQLEQRGYRQIMVWGNSFGGYLAARLAAVDERIAALVVNGGSDRPAEIVTHFPRFVGKVEALYGIDDPVRARGLIAQHRLPIERLAAIACPALVLHGEPDRIFLADSARRIANGITGPVDLRIWADGEHCLYNHAFERDSTIAGWLATVR